MSKQPSKILYAQDFPRIAACGPHVGGGFNSRVQGVEFYSATRGSHQFERGEGWYAADEMIATGQIYFVHPFPHKNCRSSGFVYGGTWACNECRTDGFQKPWWNVRVMKDGSAWCVVGEGFEDLQISDNYAFGDTRESALEAYASIMNAKTA
ncbi:hypothetical protein N5D61_24515 [Pseudomonas sp. GD03842]|uniref:hypothetical protein n=1 Tax=Pseudomonas sp. GD03842 TaxID=2975385 RepID=UPI00244815B9|nr:hypothetical protein [Pseudomonas sp. GD03842]MDH0749492.1 hypothetical protein [Pseudomonas sp. GD03842]